jgi:hypothetical protein
MLARLGLCAALGATLAVPSAALAGWTRPAPLSGCAAALATVPPLVVVPGSAPQVRSGPGAVLWTGPGGGCPRAGASGLAEAFAAQLGADGLPEPGRALSTGGYRVVGITDAVGTTFGQVLLAGTGAAGTAVGGMRAGGPGPAAGDMGLLVEGRSAGAFPVPRVLGGPATPVALASGYLGDAVAVSTLRDPALVAPHRARARDGAAARARGAQGWELAVRVQRHYSAVPAPPRLVPVGPSRPVALAVALDFRSDVLLVWASGHSIYAREITQAGALGSVSRLGGASGAPELRAVFSDDDRAIVTWREQVSASRGAVWTDIEASISGPELSFGRPAVVERFADLRGLVPPAGSLRLTRLSSEAVMMAWTGLSAGRYVVRASPVSLHRGVWAPVTISTAPPASPASLAAAAGVGASMAAVGASAARAGRGAGAAARAPSASGTEALLADLVPGPRAEALALWTVARRLRDGALDARHRAIEAAWGHYGGPGEARFAAPEVVAAAGPNGTPAAAFDPQRDTALAAWASGTGEARIEYALRGAGPPSQMSAWPPVALSAVSSAQDDAAEGTVPLPCDYASIESRAMRIGTPLAAWRK